MRAVFLKEKEFTTNSIFKLEEHTSRDFFILQKEWE